MLRGYPRFSVIMEFSGLYCSRYSRHWTYWAPNAQAAYLTKWTLLLLVKQGPFDLSGWRRNRYNLYGLNLTEPIFDVPCAEAPAIDIGTIIDFT